MKKVKKYDFFTTLQKAVQDRILRKAVSHINLNMLLIITFWYFFITAHKSHCALMV